MTILDRYIARQFAQNVVALLVIIASFIVVVDATLNVHRFVRRADELIELRELAGGPLARLATTGWVVFDLWWPRLLQLSGFLLGFVMIGAMGFTCAQMVRHREFVAILASGQSLRRVIRPIIVVALAFTALQALNHELVLPRIAPLLTRGPAEAGAHAAAHAESPMVADGQRRLLLAGGFDAGAGVLRDVYVWERNEQGLATRRIRADRALWDGAGWRLEGGVAERPVVGDRPPRPEPVHRLETDLTPRAIAMALEAAYAQSLSFGQVGRLLAATRGESAGELARQRDRLERVRWGRFSVMAANLLGLVIAMPYFLTRVPANMVVQSIRAAPVAMGAVMGAIIATSVPFPGLPAAVGVFLPVVILIPMSLGMVMRVRS